MKIFGFEIKRAKDYAPSYLRLNSGSGFMYRREKPMLLSTVYRCVDLISDSAAVLPLKTYHINDGYKKEATDLPLHYILNTEPNRNMSRYTFFKTLMASVLLKGNGYALIVRDRNLNVTELQYIPSDMVTVGFIKTENGEKKAYRVNGIAELIEERDMIHILNFSYDGISGISTLEHAAQTLNIATSSEEHAAEYFDGGATSGILSVEGIRLNKQQKDEIYETWYSRMEGKKNGVAVLEGNMKYTPITISPKDAQLLESRQFNVIDICRFFSVSPIKAFDLSKSSYATVEATQIQYLVDTVQPIVAKLELELNRKILLPSERGKLKLEFDTAAILRTDKAAQANYWKDLFYIGAITPNEIRKESNLTRVEDGDNVYIPVNVQRINTDNNEQGDKELSRGSKGK